MVDKASRPIPLSVHQLVCDTRVAIDALLGSTGLPAPSVVVRPDEVHITVSDPDDLPLWLHALGGAVRRSPAFEGAELWTLHTCTPMRGDGTVVPIAVHTVVVEGEELLSEVTAAVAS